MVSLPIVRSRNHTQVATAEGLSQAWRYRPLILASKRRQENYEFKAIFYYTLNSIKVGLCYMIPGNTAPASL